MKRPRPAAGLGAWFDAWHGRGVSLAFTLLLSMLAVVGVAVGGMLSFSNFAVRQEVGKLPPEVQAYLRARDEAERRGEPLPAPPSPRSGAGSSGEAASPLRTTTVLPSPATSGGLPWLSEAQTAPPSSAVIGPQWPALTVGQPSGRSRDRSAILSRRTRSFVRDVQRGLIEGGLIAAAVATLLSFLIAQRVARPVTAVSGAARRLASGDLSVRAPVLRGEREVADLARNFNEMAANLQTLESERRQAAASIAHELRTPLAIIQARLDAISDGVYPASPEQIILLSNQTQVLTRLVEDLRTLTLADAEGLNLSPGRVDLAELTVEVVRDLSDHLAARGLSVDLRAETTPLTADQVRLRQIISNLLQNAIRHARTRILVEVGGQGCPYLRVSDDGPGLPEEQREAVFMRFIRLDESRARDTGGSGLGLAIVRALALAHGGQVRAGQGPLGGAQFTVTLPAVPTL